MNLPLIRKVFFTLKRLVYNFQQIFIIKGVLDKEVYVMDVGQANLNNITAWNKEYSYSVCFLAAPFFEEKD